MRPHFFEVDRSARGSEVTRSYGGEGCFDVLCHAVHTALSHFTSPARWLGHAGTQNPAPKRICFAKTNANRAEFDRVDFSAHRFEACQNSSVMTSLQCCRATSSAALQFAAEHFADSTLSPLYKRDYARRNEYRHLGALIRARWSRKGLWRPWTGGGIYKTL